MRFAALAPVASLSATGCLTPGAAELPSWASGKTDAPPAKEAERSAPQAAEGGDAALLCDAGYSLYARGCWADAEVVLRQAVAADPTSARAWNNFGLALAMQGKDRAAVEAFERAVTPAEAQANLGSCLAVRGRRDEARAAYRRALELEPSLHTARAALAQLDAPPAAR